MAAASATTMVETLGWAFTESINVANQVKSSAERSRGGLGFIIDEGLEVGGGWMGIVSFDFSSRVRTHAQRFAKLKSKQVSRKHHRHRRQRAGLPGEGPRRRGRPPSRIPKDSCFFPADRRRWLPHGVPPAVRTIWRCEADPGGCSRSAPSCSIVGSDGLLQWSYRYNPSRYCPTNQLCSVGLASFSVHACQVLFDSPRRYEQFFCYFLHLSTLTLQ